MSNTIYSTFRRWQVAAFVFLVLFLALATGIEAQDDPTLEPTAAPVVVEVEVPAEETAPDETTENETGVTEETLNKVLLYTAAVFGFAMTGIAYLQGKNTKELGQSVPIQLFLSGAANLAGLTKATDDDKKVQEIADLSGYTLKKVGGIVVAVPSESLPENDPLKAQRGVG